MFQGVVIHDHGHGIGGRGGGVCPSTIVFGNACRVEEPHERESVKNVWIRRLKSFFIRPIKDKARYMDSSSNQFYTNILKKKQILR